MSANPNLKTLKTAFNIGRSKSAANATQVTLKKQTSIKKLVSNEEKMDFKIAGLGKQFDVLL